MSLKDKYEYFEEIEGDLLVVDDLYENDLYAESVDARYEVRFHGLRLGRFDDWDAVESFLESESFKKLES